MSSKQFFANRYSELGWKFESVNLKQSIRINIMNISEQKIIERLSKRGVVLERILFLEHGYRVVRSKFSVGATSEYLLGLYSIQETASQIPVTLFTKLKNETVLDACAAPGGKTVQMADIMQNTGAIVAVDVSKDRLTALTNHLERCNTSNVIVHCLDAREMGKLGMKFSRILLDVPCSGNFATDIDWFNNRTLKDVKANADLQKEILRETAGLLQNDGEIIYSTCSLEPEEDELNMQWAIDNLNLKPQRIRCYGEDGLTSVFGRKLDDSVSSCKRIWPFESQGFFICKLKRSQQ